VFVPGMGFHTTGENADSLDSAALKRYWGHVEEWTPHCTSRVYIQRDMSQVVWSDKGLGELVCSAAGAAAYVPGTVPQLNATSTSSGSSSSRNATKVMEGGEDVVLGSWLPPIRNNTMIYSRGTGNLAVAWALSQRCSIPVQSEWIQLEVCGHCVDFESRGLGDVED